MRRRGIHHVEFSVIDYEESIKFYDRMFGWLGYRSFWTLDLGYHSTYYLNALPFFHSYIGIQPARGSQTLNHEDHATGIHHVALWAKNKREIDQFYAEFLLKEGVRVTDPPAAYPVYAPGYYAVFFTDRSGIRWELAYIPRVPSLRGILETFRVLKAEQKRHPEWKQHPAKEAMRALPPRKKP